jgi:hypothetical protein
VYPGREATKRNQVRREKTKQYIFQIVTFLVYSPGNGSQVGKWYSNKEGQESTNDATKTGSPWGLGSHTTGLEIQGCQVTKTENKNGSPIPENSIGEGR